MLHCQNQKFADGLNFEHDFGFVASEKILFGSNGLSWERYLEQWSEMGLREDSSHAMLVENPKRVFKV